MSIETALPHGQALDNGQPYPYQGSSWSSPTGPGSPAGRT